MSAEGQTSAEQDKLIVQRFWHEVVSRGDRNVAHEILAPDYLLHDPDASEDGELNGPDEVVDLIEKFRGRYQDLRAAVDWQLTAEGGHVVTHYSLGGTVVGTNNRVEVEGLSISHLSGGRITHSWASWDGNGLLEQDPGPNAVSQADGPAPEVAPGPEPVEEEPSQVEKSKTLVKRFWDEVFNEDKHPVAWDVFHQNYRLYGPAATGSGGVNGPDGIVSLVKRLRDQNQGSNSTVRRQLTAEGNRIVTYYEIRRPDRKRKVEGMSVSRLSDEKIWESWANWDAMALLVDHGHHDKHFPRGGGKGLAVRRRETWPLTLGTSRQRW